VPDASNSKLIRGQPICYLPASIMARLKGSREVVRKRINAQKQLTADRVQKNQIDTSVCVARSDDD